MRFIMIALFSFILFLSLMQLVSCQEEVKEVPMKDLKFSDNQEGKSIPHYDEKPFTGYAVNLHPNGNKYIIQRYVDGLKNGQWIIFYENGDTQKMGFSLNGIEDSIYKEWYPNMQLRYKYHYDNGKKTGIWKSWYESGVRWTERNFVNGELHGKVLVFDTEGTLTKEYTYQNGELIDRTVHRPLQPPGSELKNSNLK